VRLRRLHARALAQAAALVCFLVSAEAGAYRYLACNDNPVRWSAPFGVVQNVCSIPAGTLQAKAYAATVGQWRGVVGMQDTVYHYGTWPVNHCFVDLDDGWNDVALVDASSIDGALGATVIVRKCDEIQEANILVANLSTQTFENPDEAFAAGSCPYNPMQTGMATLLHELGHAHGLSITAAGGPDNHALNFSIMRPSPPVPLGGGSPGAIHVQPMPDDAAGGRFLYPSSMPEINLMASAQRLSDGAIRNTTSWHTIQRCRGDTFTFRWTTANTGTVAVDSDQRFFLATSPSAHSMAGINLATWYGARVLAQKEVHVSVTTTVPCGTPPGFYWIYHETDAAHTHAEASESDNVIHNSLTLQVGACGCS
jgi:hypothetical protein